MELIDQYKKSLQAIYDHVGFKEDWVFYPIDDVTDKYWNASDDETVCYADSEQELKDQSGEYFESEIYKQRFYDKYVYRGELFTMIFSNPGIDGMKYFSLFDNSKERV